MDIRQALIQAEGDVLAAAELVLASARTREYSLVPLNPAEMDKAGNVVNRLIEHSFQIRQPDGEFGSLKVRYHRVPRFSKIKGKLNPHNMFVEVKGREEEGGLDVLDPNARQNWNASQLTLHVWTTEPLEYIRDIVPPIRKEIAEEADHDYSFGNVTFKQAMKNAGLPYFDYKKKKENVVKSAERPLSIQYAYKKL